MEMFKGRIGIWVTVICVCFAITFFWTNIPKWAEKKDVQFQVEDFKDKDFALFLRDIKINKYNIRFMDDPSPDIIISNNDEAKEGYEIVKSSLYSPIVGYVSIDADKNSDGFIKYSADSPVRMIDLLSILEGIENGYTWEKIGVSKKVIKGNICLTIPDEQSLYYSDVVELFYITLAGKKVVSDEERELLKPRVENILSHCNKVSSIIDAVYSEFSSPSVDSKFFVGPEFLFAHFGDAKSYRNYNNTFIPVYFRETVYIYGNIYLKTIYSDENKTSFNFYNIVKDKESCAVDFFRRSGWRMQGANCDVSYYISKYLIKFLSVN